MTAAATNKAQNGEDLPEGWAAASIPEVIGENGLFSDGDWIESKDQDVNGDVRLIQLADIGDGEYRNRSSRFLTQSKAAELGCTFLSSGDILVARMPEPLGRACIFPGDPKPSVTAVDVCIIRPQPGAVVARWLLHIINSPDFRGAIAEFERGTTRKRISRTNLGLIHVPVAPLAEQKRIVAKVEALLARVNAARERLAKSPAILKRFRQSVLAAACSGQLTADWRGVNPDVASYSGVPKETLSCIEDEFPSTWVPTRLGHLMTLVTSGSRGWAKYYADSGSVFIRAQNINSDRLDLDDIAYVRLPNRAEGLRTKVQTDDLLVTITGANVTKSARVDLDLEDAYVSQHVALVRLADPQLSKFLFRWIVSPGHGRKQLQEAAYGQGKPGLNLDNIRQVEVVLPPLAEQHEIVRHVEALFALADKIEAHVQTATARVEKITQAILAKAFRGELVPTEAELARQENRDYEPASVLLERIHAARDQGEVHARGDRPRSQRRQKEMT